LGGNARFQLSQGLYLLSTGNVGISYGPRHQTRLTSQTALSFDQINGPYKNLTTQFKNRSDLFIPFFETRLDIGYRRTFDNNQYALDLFVGYEYHLFNDAVLTSNSSGLYDITESLNLTNHNLGLQGMNLGATFSF